jgi:hypothetical protein
MSRRAAKVTQADVARVIRAAEQVAPGRFEVEITPEGRILVRPSTEAPKPEPQVAPEVEFDF